MAEVDIEGIKKEKIEIESEDGIIKVKTKLGGKIIVLTMPEDIKGVEIKVP